MKKDLKSIVAAQEGMPYEYIRGIYGNYSSRKLNCINSESDT